MLYQHFPGKQELYLALLDEGVDALVSSVQEALASTDDNRERVEAAIHAYFDFVDDADGTYRLVFESDLTNVDEVRRRVDLADELCAAQVAVVIATDTGLSEDEAMLLATGMTGMAQTSAGGGFATVAHCRRKAARLVMDLVWRGISAFPHSPPDVGTPRRAGRRSGLVCGRTPHRRWGSDHVDDIPGGTLWRSRSGSRTRHARSRSREAKRRSRWRTRWRPRWRSPAC